jgi:hypothetical protein
MTNIEKNTVRDMVRMAEVYGSIYEPRYRTIATNAFLDGMAIHGIGTMKNMTPEQIDTEICRKVREITERLTQEAGA